MSLVPATKVKRSKKGKRRGRPKAVQPGEGVDKYASLVPLLNAEELRACWKPVVASSGARAAGMTVAADGCTVTSAKGYRTVLASLGVQSGTWHFEVALTRMGPTGSCRLGWARPGAELQAPVGYDSHGYCYRGKDGGKVHEASGSSYGKPFQEGDVIGCTVHLEQELKDNRQAVIQHRQDFYTPAGQEAPAATTGTCPDSWLAFTCNGEAQGVAFRELKSGNYFPALSIFTGAGQTEGATATFNFGPSFQFPPPSLEGAGMPRPVSELAGPPPPAAPSPAAEAQPAAEAAPAGPAQ